MGISILVRSPQHLHKSVSLFHSLRQDQQNQKWQLISFTEFDFLVSVVQRSEQNLVQNFILKESMNA